MNSNILEGLAFPASLVATVVLLLFYYRSYPYWCFTYYLNTYHLNVFSYHSNGVIYTKQPMVGIQIKGKHRQHKSYLDAFITWWVILPSTIVDFWVVGICYLWFRSSSRKQIIIIMIIEIVFGLTRPCLKSTIFQLL